MFNNSIDIKIVLLLNFVITIPLFADKTEIALIKVANVPPKAVYVTQPKGENKRLFVVNQNGKIYVVENKKTKKRPFLDISDRVHSSLTPGSEEGLLGLAFHPDYVQNGYFYVNYVNKNDSTIVSRFSTSDNIAGDGPPHV